MKTRIILLTFILIFALSCSEDNVTEPDIDYVQEVIDNVNISSLTQFVRILSGEESVTLDGIETTIQSRNWELEGNDLAADYIEDTFESFGLTVTNQEFDAMGRNVYATLPGTLFPDQYYIIGAHYDNCGYRNCDPDSSSIAPGADDNASGTAAVLEAARILSQYNSMYTLIFVCWDEEEIGLLGSWHFADDARENNMQINGYINLDMIAYDSNNDRTTTVIVWDVENIPELGLKTTYINNAYDLGLNIEYVYRDRGSDFIPFWVNNYPAISIIEDYDDFNAYYHSRDDLLTNMNLEYYESMTKLAIGTLADYAFNAQ